MATTFIFKQGIMAQHTSLLFQRLKPICVNVTKDCSAQHLNEAIEVLKCLQKSDINEIAMLEYVLFPFRITLQKRKLMKEEQELLCFRCLQIIFSKCDSSVIRDEIISWCLNTFSLYFASKNFNENDKIKEQLVNDDISEERKLELVKLIQSMFININSVTMTILYQDKYMPVLGHVLSIILYLIEMEKNRELQVAALKCLKTLSGFSFKDKHCIDSAGKCWASFLPGICMTFNRLFTLKVNIGQNMLASSLETFVYIISIVLNDDLNNDLLSTEMTIEHLFNSKLSNMTNDVILESTDTKKLGVARSQEWLQKTSSNVNFVFKNILPVIMCHRTVKVRMALLAFVEKLLLSCMKTLSSSIMDFLDVLLKHSCDESEDIKNEAKRILNLSMGRFQDAKINSVKSALNERLYGELLSLPRVMSSSNDDLKQAKLQMIKGYMEFYGESMEETLNTYPMLERFLISLIHILELETDNVNLVEEQTSVFRQAIDIGSETYDNRFYRKNFKFFRNITIYKLIKDIIYLLAKYGNPDLLIDYLIEQSSSSSLLRKQSFLILNEILLGLNNTDQDNINSIIELVLSTYLDDQLIKLPVTNKLIITQNNIIDTDELLITKQNRIDNDRYTRNAIPFEVLNSNIQLICILLEGISNCAQVLKTEFNNCMIQILYPVLEKVGSTNAAVSVTAVETLTNIVRFCDYKDITDLIFSNSDYLLNSITLQLRRLVYGAAAPAVLCVVLRFCNSSLIPIISEVIGDVFEALDEYQEDVASDMLVVLKHYNIAVDNCYNVCKQTGSEQQSRFKHTNIKKELTDVCNDEVSVESFLEEYSKIVLHAHGVIEEEDISDVNVDEELKGEEKDYMDTEEEVNKAKTPFHYQIVITALEKCVAFTAASHCDIRLKALEVVLHGVYALRDRENDLLPLIHKLWPPIICRLKDQEHVLVLKALDVVCSMVEYSGNFITKRMSIDFFPYALKFLEDNCEALTKDKCSFTQLCKTQKRLISFLGDIVPPLDLSTDLFCNISSAIIPYTNCNFHLSIQETAVSALTKFYSYRPNVIWLLCQFAYTSNDGDNDLISSHISFKPLNFAKHGNDGDNYGDNMLKLWSLTGSVYNSAVE